jgi:hypothetical protein
MRWPAAALTLFFATVAIAQDDVLAVEQRQDLKARDALVPVLQRTKTDLHWLAITPKDLCRQLEVLSGDKVSFVCGKTAAAATPMDLDLKAVTPWSAMAAAQTASGLRFVYRSGVVFLVPKDEVKPLTLLMVYDLRSAVMPVKSFPGPRLGLDAGDNSAKMPAEEDSGTTVSGFTADGIETLIKAHVTPELWAGDTVSLHQANGLFFVRQTVAGHRELRQFVADLGLVSDPRAIEREPAPPAMKPLRRRPGR